VVDGGVPFDPDGAAATPRMRATLQHLLERLFGGDASGAVGHDEATPTPRRRDRRTGPDDA
jgi:hypothetical protein